ncbi:MAG: DNA recombination protein RmuC [Thermodesulfobacteriaceae bacterium]|nr:DNA recombination protein RmuC [Thermodesulfobacteriaceae bacterium]
MIEILLIIIAALLGFFIVLILIKNPLETLKANSDRLSEIQTILVSLKTLQERAENLLKDGMKENRDEMRSWSGQFREEVVQRLERLRETLEERFRLLQEENAKKLDQMRELVDKELHATLERRLGESFKLVSDRLEQVHKGLGEMQALASSVGDLKKVLSNVKTRGILGEIQLGALLEQILTPEQYVKNFATKKGSNERVEFAIKLPGRDGSGRFVYLPIDAKFHEADYQRLIDAYETGDHNIIEEAAKQLEMEIKKSARDIRDKYLDPPNTTDFAIMFLPVEGLYAEVLRRPKLFETIQRDYKVVITGPTTLAAFLNSLQMGFRTLAIEKRSTEIWELLGAVKSEFSKFGDLLEKTHKKLLEASHTIEDAAKKTRSIERKLKDVEQIPEERAQKLLSLTDD